MQIASDESIHKVLSVDLVADPATVSGLFESETKHENGDNAMSETITVAVLKEKGVYEAIREDIAKELHESGELESLKQLNTALTSELATLKKAAAAHAKLAKVKAAIGEAKLPETAVTDLFLEQCVAAEDGAGAIVGLNRPHRRQPITDTHGLADFGNCGHLCRQVKGSPETGLEHGRCRATCRHRHCFCRFPSLTESSC